MQPMLRLRHAKAFLVGCFGATAVLTGDGRAPDQGPVKKSPDDFFAGSRAARSQDATPASSVAPRARRALEGFALEELKAGRMTEVQLRKMLGLARIQLDGFLKTHGIYQDVTMEDIERDVADLKACMGT